MDVRFRFLSNLSKELHFLCPDANGEVQPWMQDAFDCANWHLTHNIATWDYGRRQHDRLDYTKFRVDLPIPNYPPAPPMRINQLYWPTGAIRWGCVHVLCDRDTASFIESLAIQEATSCAGVFEIVQDNAWPPVSSGQASDSTTRRDCWLMHPITVQRLTGDYFLPQATGTDSLYIVKFVCPRYWWQFRQIPGDAEIHRGITWWELFQVISSALGMTSEIAPDAGLAAAEHTAANITVFRSVHANYLYPDADRFNRLRDNAAMMLESWCMSLGRRLVSVNWNVNFAATKHYVCDYNDSRLLLAHNMTLPGSASDVNHARIKDNFVAGGLEGQYQ